MPLILFWGGWGFSMQCQDSDETLHELVKHKFREYVLSILHSCRRQNPKLAQNNIFRNRLFYLQSGEEREKRASVRVRVRVRVRKRERERES